MVLCILILIFVKFESQCSIVLEAAVHFIEDSVMMGWAGIWRNTIYTSLRYIHQQQTGIHKYYLFTHLHRIIKCNQIWNCPQQCYSKTYDAPQQQPPPLCGCIHPHICHLSPHNEMFIVG